MAVANGDHSDVVSRSQDNCTILNTTSRKTTCESEWRRRRRTADTTDSHLDGRRVANSRSKGGSPSSKTSTRRLISRRNVRRRRTFDCYRMEYKLKTKNCASSP